MRVNLNKQINYCSTSGCRLPALPLVRNCRYHLADTDNWRSGIKDAVRRGEDFAGKVFLEADLSGLNLDGIGADGALFDGCDLSHSRLDRGNLTGATFRRCLMNGATFTAACLTAASLDGCSGRDANFDDADFTDGNGRNSRWLRSSFRGARLTGGDWSRAVFEECNLASVTANDLHAPWSSFRGAVMDGGSFRFALLGGSDLRAVSARGADISRANLLGVDTSGADFSNADLFYARLSSGLFAGTKFGGAVVRRTVFRSALVDGETKTLLQGSGAVSDRLRTVPGEAQ